MQLEKADSAGSRYFQVLYERIRAHTSTPACTYFPLSNACELWRGGGGVWVGSTRFSPFEITLTQNLMKNFDVPILITVALLFSYFIRLAFGANCRASRLCKGLSSGARAAPRVKFFSARRPHPPGGAVGIRYASGGELARGFHARSSTPPHPPPPAPTCPLCTKTIINKGPIIHPFINKAAVAAVFADKFLKSIFPSPCLFPPPPPGSSAI